MVILSVSKPKFAADTNSFEVENYSARDNNLNRMKRVIML